MALINKSVLFVIALLFSFNLFAQKVDYIYPVNVKESVKQISENEFQLILDVEIDENWKLYIAPDNGEGPIVFSATVKKNKNVETIKAFETVTKSKKTFDPVFQMEVVYLENTATFIQTVKLKNPKKTGMIKVEFEYMTCDGTKCIPPTQKVIDYNIETGKSSMGSSRVDILSNELFDSEF